MADANRRMDTERRLRPAARHSLAVLLATTALGVVSAHAVDGTWLGNNPGDVTEWIDPANWTSSPGLPDGTATFTNNGASATVDVNGIVNIGAISFTAAAPAYTTNINDVFVVNGIGVTNNSAATQTYNVTSSLIFQNGSSASTGPGPVRYNNSGTISFQDSSTAGSATVTNNGDVEFNNTSTAATSTVTNNATINFQDSSTAGSAHFTNNASGTIAFNTSSSAGTATFGGGGALQFNNSSTAAGATVTTISGAPITFNNTSTAANAHIDLVGALLSFNDTSSAGNAVVTMSNNLFPGGINFNNSSTAGNANITVVFSTGAGNGTLNFLDTSTAGNATIVNNPGIGSGGSTVFGILGGTDTSNAGTSHITTNNMGSTSFLAHTSALNATIVNNSGGNTNFQDQSTAGNATIVNNSGGTTTFGVPLVGTDTASAGSAVIINNSGGTTAFFAATTAGSATIINSLGGIVQFGDSGGANDTAIAGSATIDNSGVVSFNSRTTAGTATLTTHSGGNIFFFDTSSGGGARFITDAGGTVDISALTNAGTTAGSIEGAGSYVLGARNLAVGSNNLSTAVSGVISGIGGSLTKVGTGTLILSGTNTFTGPTTVTAGTLTVSGTGSITSNLTNNATFNNAGTVTGTVSNAGTFTNSVGATVSGLVTNTAGVTTDNGTLAGGAFVSGGILTGAGSVAGLTIANGGTFRPGNGTPGSAMTVTGNLAFQSGALYLVQLNPATSTLANVTGTAILGGATVSAVFAPGSYVDRQYTIVNATGGVAGTFNPAVTSNMANIQSTLSYDANNAYLNIALTFVPPPGVVLNVNQQNVANALTGFFNRTGSIPATFAALDAAGLTTASGELGTGIIQSSIKADDLFLNLLLDPSIAGRAGGFATGAGAAPFADEEEARAYSAKRHATPSERAAFAMAKKAPSLLATQQTSRWSVWGAAYGGSATTQGNVAVGSQDTTSRVYGIAAGADYKVTPSTLLGFALAGGGTSYTLANAMGRGSSDLFQAGAFARHNIGPAYLSAALAYGWHDVTTNRTVALAGVDQLQGRFRAETFSGRFEGGYRYATPVIGITPYAAAQMISFNLPNYAEQSLVGGGLFALNYASQTTTATRTELGLRGDKSVAMQDAVLTLRGRAAWAHDYNPDRAVNAVFQALPGASFVVNGARGNPDAALVSAGAEMKWLNGFSLMGTFEGEFSANATSYAGKGVARYTW